MLSLVCASVLFDFITSEQPLSLLLMYQLLFAIAFFASLIDCHPTQHLPRRQTSNSTNSTTETTLTTIPQYVFDYAPLVWLDIVEEYFPSDIGTQVSNTHPDVNYTAITDAPSPLNLEKLSLLNAYGDGGTNVYLTSDFTPYDYPSWFTGVQPDTTGATPDATSATIIIVPKANNTLDAFYFYFYAFNQGNWVLGDPNLEFGDHVGDWEHTMLRFDTTTCTPTAMWFSQHSFGEAFTYSAVEKSPSSPLRPIAYSAKGTHANYAIAGTHDHTVPDVNLPIGPLDDYTSQGTLWDPTLNSYRYMYEVASDTFNSPNNEPTSWLYFTGQWGDDALPDSTPGQVDVFGEQKVWFSSFFMKL